MAMAQVSAAPLPPQSFERSMIFVDGTNLLQIRRDEASSEFLLPVVPTPPGR